MMGAYRCSTCNVNYRTDEKCRFCGGSVWWGSNIFPSTKEEIQMAIHGRLSDLGNEHAEPVDKVHNWRFEQLVLAGYPLDIAEEIAERRTIDLHQAVALAGEAGAMAAYFKLTG